MHLCIDNRNLPRKKVGHWHLSLCVLLLLERNTAEVPQLTVFQKVPQLDLVLEDAFVPGTCNLYYRGGWCASLCGVTWSSNARFGKGRCSYTLEPATSTIEAEGVRSVCDPWPLLVTWRVAWAATQYFYSMYLLTHVIFQFYFKSRI